MDAVPDVVVLQVVHQVGAVALHLEHTETQHRETGVMGGSEGSVRIAGQEPGAGRCGSSIFVSCLQRFDADIILHGLVLHWMFRKCK